MPARENEMKIPMSEIRGLDGVCLMGYWPMGFRFGHGGIIQ